MISVHSIYFSNTCPSSDSHYLFLNCHISPLSGVYIVFFPFFPLRTLFDKIIPVSLGVYFGRYRFWKCSSEAGSHAPKVLWVVSLIPTSIFCLKWASCLFLLLASKNWWIYYAVMRDKAGSKTVLRRMKPAMGDLRGKFVIWMNISKPGWDIYLAQQFLQTAESTLSAELKRVLWTYLGIHSWSGAYSLGLGSHPAEPPIWALL